VTDTPPIAELLRDYRYPPTYAELHLAIIDDAGRSLRRVLSIRNGRAHLQSGGYGRVRVRASDLRQVLLGKASAADAVADQRVDGPADDTAAFIRVFDG